LSAPVANTVIEILRMAMALKRRMGVEIIFNPESCMREK
jgi:hypothetical protein